MTAVFIGTSSCGFLNNRTYNIEIRTGNDGYVWVLDKNGTGKCPYQSIKKLAENWETKK